MESNLLRELKRVINGYRDSKNFKFEIGNISGNVLELTIRYRNMEYDALIEKRKEGYKIIAWIEEGNYLFMTQEKLNLCIGICVDRILNSKRSAEEFIKSVHMRSRRNLTNF